MTRDMVGYGGKWPDMRWPNGARLAVSVAVNFEEGAEAKQGKPRLLNIGHHLRIAGRPARFPAFEKVLARLAGLGDQVWVARRIDIAKAWRAATRA